MTHINTIKKVIKESLNEAVKVKFPAAEMKALTMEYKTWHSFNKKSNQSNFRDMLPDQDRRIARAVDKLLEKFKAANPHLEHPFASESTLKNNYEYQKSGAATWAKKVIQKLTDENG